MNRARFCRGPVFSFIVLSELPLLRDPLWSYRDLGKEDDTWEAVLEYAKEAPRYFGYHNHEVDETAQAITTYLYEKQREKIEKLPPGECRKYVITACRNAMRKLRTQNAARRSFSLDEAIDVVDPKDEFDVMETKEYVRVRLEKLDEKCRDLLKRRANGVAYAATAAQFGKTAAAIKEATKRCRAKLRQEALGA